MISKKRLVMFAISAVVAVGCGKNNDENNSNNSNNANNSNNSSNNANNSNNTSNNPNNTTNTNNANNTNNTNNTNNSNNSNNMTNMYTPFEFTCPDVVTPAGTVTDLAGTYDIDAGCVGENAFGDLELLCPTGVLTNVEYTDWTGRLIVTDTNQFIAAIGNSFSAEIFAPEACATQLGGGTCDGLADFVDMTVGTTSTTCVDEGTVGDCYCTITGPGGVRRIGTVVDGANGGEVDLSFLVKQDDDTYELLTETWEIQVDATTGVMQNTDPDAFTSYSGTVDAAGSSECEQYCLGFIALCNDNPNIDAAYDDTLDCVTQCMGFAAGTAGDMAGDTRACRIYHLGAAADPSDVGNPDTHCPHAQATATAPCVD